MTRDVPSVAEVLDTSCADVLRFKDPRPHDITFAYFLIPRKKQYQCRVAKTSCGHNWITLRAWKSDNTWQTEHYGQKVHCAECGELQSFGEATPGKRRQFENMVKTSDSVMRVLNSMSPLSDHDDEPYGGGV